MKILALTIPGGKDGVNVVAPPNIPSGPNAASNIINVGLAIFVTLGIVTALIFVLYGGVLWITSQGDKGKVDRARRTITYAIVGLIVIILSFTIVRIVGYLVGASAVSNIGK